jgi:hypothetical protein
LDLSNIPKRVDQIRQIYVPESIESRIQSSVQQGERIEKDTEEVPIATEHHNITRERRNLGGLPLGGPIDQE